MWVAVVEDLGEFLEVTEVPGLLVGHQEGDQSLIMGPPQLHVPLQLYRAPAVSVQEVVQAAMFPVPAILKRPLNEASDGRLLQLLVTSAHGVTQQEPACLYRVTYNGQNTKSRRQGHKEKIDFNKFLQHLQQYKTAIPTKSFPQSLGTRAQRYLCINQSLGTRAQRYLCITQSLGTRAQLPVYYPIVRD